MSSSPDPPVLTSTPTDHLPLHDGRRAIEFRESSPCLSCIWPTYRRADGGIALPERLRREPVSWIHAVSA